MLFYIGFGCAARRLDIHVTYTAILQTARSPPGPTHGHHSVMDSVPRAALTPLWLFRNCRHCLLFMLNQAIFSPHSLRVHIILEQIRRKSERNGVGSA